MTTPDAASDAAVDGASISDGGFDGPAPDASCTSGPERDGPYQRVIISGDSSALGVIDPSVVYPANGMVGLMTYTAVPDPAHAHIAIASSVDHGATWQYGGTISNPGPYTISVIDKNICGALSCDGTDVQESSSLVLDPFDPDPQRRVKVFAHNYFYGQTAHFDLGSLVLWTAPSPAGPWDTKGVFGWPSALRSNFGSGQQIDQDPRLAGLADCILVGEPGAIVRDAGTIDLALGCPTAAGIDVRLVRSTDHGMSFDYVGKLLTTDDAMPLGAEVHSINGPDLFFANGGYHLIATPVGTFNGPHGAQSGYRGCVVVPIADLDGAKVARCDGVPIIEAAYRGMPGQFVGACSTDEGVTASGMIIPVPDFSSKTIFQVFAAGPPVL